MRNDEHVELSQEREKSIVYPLQAYGNFQKIVVLHIETNQRKSVYVYNNNYFSLSHELFIL